jgi:hypothetical protein
VIWEATMPPKALTSYKSASQVPEILRSASLRPYKTDDECLQEITSFLGLIHRRVVTGSCSPTGARPSGPKLP